MIKKEDVTIIIPSLIKPGRSAIAIKECLESLHESGFPFDNIIVATNGEFIEPIPGDTPTPHRVHNWRQGQTMAVNAAVATINTTWIMVTNDDMVFPPDWFEKLTMGLSGGTDEFTISPQLIEPTDGAPTFIKYFCGGIGGDWDKQKFMKYAKVHREEGIRSGFNLPFLMKKEVWDTIGGYDVNYSPFGSNSDSDLQYKLKLAGVQMLQNTMCPVYHFSNTSDTFTPENRPHWEKNWQYFIKKWGFPRTDDGIWEATFTIPMDKLLFKPSWIGKYGEIK